MSRLAPRVRRGRPARTALSAAALTVGLLALGPAAVAPAFAQSDPALPALPDDLAAPEQTQPPVTPPPSRVQENGIDARRFTPAPADPETAPGAATPSARDERNREDYGPNGYQYAPPTDPGIAPQYPGALPGVSPRLVPGVGGRPGFDPDDSPVLLGVSGTDTVAGVLVTGVVRGTPAERAGLERGDRVLSVAGYQVGIVATPTGRRVYPLGVELARRLNRTGDAVLLVQDHRTGQITTVTVRPVPRYGPTNPPGYPSPYDTGYGADSRPIEPNPYAPNPYAPNPYDANPFDRDRFDPYPGGRPRR